VKFKPGQLVKWTSEAKIRWGEPESHDPIFLLLEIDNGFWKILRPVCEIGFFTIEEAERYMEAV